jgi:hypothetical protein
MYYYYNYYAPETGKLTITLNFKEKNKEPVSLEQLTEFLNTLNELHRRVLYLTQPEYSKDNNNFDNFDKISMLSYHQLEIEKIKRENPFFLTLSFRLVTGGVTSYWAFWKILISICNRYGKNTKNLIDTIEEAFRRLEHVSSKFRQLRIDSKIDAVLGNIDSGEYAEYIDSVKQKIVAALTNPNFKKYYDLLCENSIMITDFISMFDPGRITDLEDLVQSIKGEQIIFLKDFSDKAK